MDRPTGPAARPEPLTAPAAAPPPEPVQRWRITFSREPVPSESVGKAATDAWQVALLGSGLAIATAAPGPTLAGPARARLAVAPPLPAAAAGRAELAELWLLERVPAWRLREALAGRLPEAHCWVDAEDIWLGAPPLPAQVVGAEWTVGVAATALDPVAIEAATRVVMASRSLPRVRAKAGGDRPYDLRPLLRDVRLSGSADGQLLLRVETRFDPALGSGRPEEVVAVVGEAAGLETAPSITSMVRERLVLADPARNTVADRPVSSARRRRR